MWLRAGAALTFRVDWGRGQPGLPEGEAGGAAGPNWLTGVPGAGVVMGLLTRDDTGATNCGAGAALLLLLLLLLITCTPAHACSLS